MDKTDRPVVQLEGQDSNVFNVIGLTKRAIERHSGREAASEWAKKALALHSYDEVMALVFETCEVE